jgi:hypothetical protein
MVVGPIIISGSNVGSKNVFKDSVSVFMARSRFDKPLIKCCAVMFELAGKDSLSLAAMPAKSEGMWHEYKTGKEAKPTRG